MRGPQSLKTLETIGANVVSFPMCDSWRLECESWRLSYPETQDGNVTEAAQSQGLPQAAGPH